MTLAHVDRDTRLSIVRSPAIIAHRAANHLQSAHELTDSGIDLVEADLWLYRNRLELRHSKTLGPFPIRWDRWSLELVGDDDLTLDRLLRSLPDTVQVLLDIKGRHPRLAAQVVRTMRQYRPNRSILVCSQHWRQLDAFRQYEEAILVHSISNRRQFKAVRPRLAAIDHDAVSIHKRLLTPDVIRSLRQDVSFIMTWPINDEREAEQMWTWGIDGLITDEPERLLRWRREQREPADTRNNSA